MIIGNEELHEEASSSLQRIQKFDAHDLARESDLGTSLNFKDAISPVG